MTLPSEFGTAAVDATINVLGGKWKLLLLWHISTSAKRYGALKRLVPSISEKMLIQQLRELERDGVIMRRVFSEIPPHVEYSLSEYGQSLLPIIEVLCVWGENHLRRQQRILA
jgi:DNA-binding HxlR family transcriptional regulator